MRRKITVRTMIVTKIKRKGTEGEKKKIVEKSMILEKNNLVSDSILITRVKVE